MIALMRFALNLLFVVSLIAVSSPAAATSYRLLSQWPTGHYEDVAKVREEDRPLCQTLLSELNQNGGPTKPYDRDLPPPWNGPVTHPVWRPVADSLKGPILKADTEINCRRVRTCNPRPAYWDTPAGQANIREKVHDPSWRFDETEFLVGGSVHHLIRMYGLISAQERAKWKLPLVWPENAELYEVQAEKPLKLAQFGVGYGWADLIAVNGQGLFFGYDIRNEDEHWQRLTRPQSLIRLGRSDVMDGEIYVLPVCDFAFGPREKHGSGPAARHAR